MAVLSEQQTERFLHDLVERHAADPDYRVEFACWFRDNGAVNLLEVSPAVIDPGDASFYGISLAVSPAEAGVERIRVVLVSPSEFQRGANEPETPGGRLLTQLRASRRFHVLRGEETPYAAFLQGQESLNAAAR